MQTRKPIVAGQFYPGQHNSCVDEVNEYIAQIPVFDELPEEIAAGIVPHAGWMFSGAPALMVFSAIKQRHEKVNTFVIFGAAHSYFSSVPGVYDRGSWLTPMGEVVIDEELADKLLKTGAAQSNPDVHRSEHSIEVQVPFIQYLFAGAKILPIVTPPMQQALKLGEAVGEIISAEGNKKIVCIGSTDLTHYGPRYGFTPMGTGADALKWSTEVNDRKFIDLALKLDPEGMLASSTENCNACGGGAAAAAVAAAKKLGKTKGLLLAHTDSNKVMKEKMGTSSADSVGYAAIVF
jgi:AmmeMemoRadiSam system protein B